MFFGNKRRPSSSGKQPSRPSHIKSSIRGRAQEDYFSFIFIINELPTNDNPDVPGGLHPRLDEHHRWLPPNVAVGFQAQKPGRAYRWTGGVVQEATEYRWYEGWIEGPPPANGTLVTQDNNMLACYKTATVFFCNQFNNFMTTPGDASARNIVDADPEESWHPLTFLHETCEDGYISQVEHGGDQQYLAAPGGSLVNQLLPQAYDYPHIPETYDYQQGDGDQGYECPPNSKGLAGNLAILIALVAFSCRNSRDLRGALTADHAWHNRRWDPHNRPSGRRDGRGVVVTIFFDPANPSGSTPEYLEEYEYGGHAVFR